jgi:hypothetical protein
MLKAREEEKALKRQLEDLNAINEAAIQKLNEMKHAVQAMFIFGCVFYEILICSISDAVYIVPAATTRDSASGFGRTLHPW